MSSTLLVDVLGSGPIPGPVAAALIERELPAKSSTWQLAQLDLSTLTGKDAVRIARRGANWSAAIVSATDDEATQIAIIEAKPFKTVLAAAADNPNLGPNAAVTLYERAIALGEKGSASRALARSAPIPAVIAAVTDDDDRDLWLAPERFEDIDDVAAAAGAGVKLAAAAVAAAHTPGSAADNPTCRTACVAALDAHEHPNAVIAHLISTRRDETLLIGTELTRSAQLPALAHAIAAISTLSGQTTCRKAHIEFTDDALSDIWNHGTEGEPAALAALIAALPVTDEMLETAAGHDDDTVVSAVAKHIGPRRDGDICSAARYVTIVAERWAHDGRREASKLLTYPLSNDGVLNILRRGNANITATWLAGRYPANPPTVEQLKALEAEPGRAGVAGGNNSGRKEIVYDIAAAIIDNQGPGALGADAATSYDPEILTQLRGALRCGRTNRTFHQAVLGAFTGELTARYGDNPTAWALAIEYADGHTGTIVELLDLVDASLN